jgi:glycosyltransferase involved in cell wall biosynthesis
MNGHDITDWPPVSVIIVSRQRPASARRAVASVQAADYPGQRQIILLEETDHPDPPGNPDILYHTIPLEHKGVGYIRNRALQYAAHPITAFTDDDCTVDRNWLKELVRPFLEQPDTGATAGAVRVPPCGPVGQCENILGFPGGGLRYVEHAHGKWISMHTFSTCNCAVYRTVTGPITFDEQCRAGGEDELLSRSISQQHPLLYNPAATVLHAPRDRLDRVFQWFVRRGHARVEMMRRQSGKRKRVWHMLLISPLFRLLLVTLLALLVRCPLPWAWIGAGSLYYLALCWRYRWSRRYFPRPATLILLPIVKLVMDLGRDIGMLQAAFPVPAKHKP